MLETQGIPTVAVCTSDFVGGGRMQAASLRMPHLPLVSVPQHYITSPPQAVAEFAEASVKEVLKGLFTARCD